MQKPFDGVMPADEPVAKTIGELLLLVGDAGKGLKPEAMNLLLGMEEDTLFPMLEQAVHDDNNADLRNGAMEVLVAFGRQAIPRLVHLLQTGNEEIRNFSAVMLGDIGRPEAVTPLIRALQDDDVNVRHGVAEALGKIGEGCAVAPLLELLKEDFWLQYPAIVALGEMRDKRAVPHLLELLDTELLVLPVVDALRKIRDKRALQTLCAILGSHDDDAIAGTAARAVVAICRDLNSVSPDTGLVGQLHGPELLHLVDSKGILKLRQLLRHGDNRDSVSAAITLLGWLQQATALPDFYAVAPYREYAEIIEESIGFMGKPAIPYLIEALTLPGPELKVTAIRAIGHLGELNDVMQLVPLLSDGSSEVQKQTLEVLRGVFDDEMLPKLFQMVESGEEEISLLASEALGRYHCYDVTAFLQRLALSPDEDARRRAAILCGHDQSNACADILCSLANDESPAVRKEAMRALGSAKISGGMNVVAKGLSDPDQSVRIEAVMSMAEFGPDAPVEEIFALFPAASDDLACAVVLAVGRIGTDAGGRALLELLEGHPLSQRLEYLMVETLGASGFKPAGAVLATRYLSHQEPDFRRLALVALGNIGDPNSLEAVAGCCIDPHRSVRVAALQALGKIGNEKALPALCSALSDSDQFVRKSAVAALGATGNYKAIAELAEKLPDPEIGKNASEELVKLGRRGLPLLHRTLRNEKSFEMRIRLIDVIGKIGERMSVDALMASLEDPSPAIRLAAIDALLLCFDRTLFKKLSHLKTLDGNEEVKAKADVALRTLTMEKFF